MLALTLTGCGHHVHVIDKAERSACSKVAAGIWNPVVFKRLTKSWLIDDLLPVMMRFYREQEQRLNCNFITERSILKFFTEEQEVNLWKRKAAGEMKDFLDAKIHNERYEAGIRQTAQGYAKVMQAGNLDVKRFLGETRKFLLATDSYSDEVFDHSLLQTGDVIRYKDLEAPRIVFAEGHLISSNPFFSFVRMKPAKGETLTIEAGLDPEKKDILSKNLFLLPLGESRYKLGATYEWEDLSDHPTKAARLDLETKFRQIAEIPYEVVGHEAGVRPSVIDRRPVLGAHPHHKNIYIFNGMGTKGVMLAPYFAEQMAGILFEGKIPHPETDVMRFAAG